MTSHLISLTTISFSNHQIYQPTFFCIKCLFLYQKTVLPNMFRIPLLALPWLFWSCYYYYPTVSLFHLSAGSFLLTCRFALYKTLLTPHHFLYTASFFCFLSLQSISEKFVTLIVTIPSPLFRFSVHVSLSSVPTTLLKLLLSRLPTTSYCQIQFYFSVFIWFYLSVSFNIMSYSLIREIFFSLFASLISHCPGFFPIALYDLSQAILLGQLLLCNLTSKC